MANFYKQQSKKQIVHLLESAIRTGGFKDQVDKKGLEQVIEGKLDALERHLNILKNA